MRDEDGAHSSSLMPHSSRLALLNEISRVLSSSLDLAVLYATIHREIGRVMDASQFYVALHERRRIHIPFLVEDGHELFDEYLEYGNTITSYAVEHGVTLLYGRTEECREWERAHGLEELIIGEEDSESGIFVPLTTGSRAIGTLSVQSRRPHAYGEEDVRTLAVIASQAAIAIENARLYAESQSDVQRMQRLLEVARAVRGSLSLPVVLDSILSSVHAVIPYHMAEIYLPDVARGEFEIVGYPAEGLGVAGHRAGERGGITRIPLGEGLVGRVYASGEPLIVPEAGLMRDSMATGAEGRRSLVMVPLQQGGPAEGRPETIGVLNLQREEAGTERAGGWEPFTEDDLRVLSLFGSQAAIAIQNARLYSEQQQRVSELQTIQSIVQQLTPLHEIPAIAELFERELGRLIDFDAYRLFVVDDASDAGKPGEGSVIPVTTGHDEFRLRIGQGIIGWIAQQGEAVRIDNTLEDERALHIPGTVMSPESVIGEPLVYEGKVRGVITLSKYGIAQFDHNEVRLLRIIAAQAALAFDRARLYAELRSDAITDPLTGLYNRRALQERLSEERSRAVRNHHPLVAIMVDIDKFKRVNDSLGHDAGDVVLMELAHLIRVAVRAEDVVARFGGEEYCVILPEIPRDGAILVAERLRKTIAGHKMPIGASAGQRKPGSGQPDPALGDITVSVGLASLDDGESGERLLSRADQAMYHAKKSGGNRTAIYEIGQPDSGSGHLRSIDRDPPS